MDEEKYRKALAEIEDIIKYADKESKEKIPEEFITFVNENKDKNYESKVTPEKTIEEQDIMYETRVILAWMYREYFATKEEKDVINGKLALEMKRLKDKYQSNIKSPEEMFKSSKTEKETKDDSLVKNDTNDNLFTKILNFIKNIFRK